MTDDANKPNIAIAVLPERQGVASAACFWAFMKLAHHAGGHGYSLIGLPPTARVDLTRNKLAEKVLSDDFTHVLMLDCDHDHPADIVERLFRWMIQDPTRLVVSGMAYRRCAPWEPTVYSVNEKGEVFAMLEWGQGLIKADAIGTPCTLISREVFERIPAPWFAFRYENAAAGKYPGEDIYFSLKCREYGIQLWVDTTCVSPHSFEGWADDKTFRAYLEYQKSQGVPEDQALIYGGMGG